MPTRNGGSILNNVAKGRTNLLLAVSNQGDWVAMFVNETIKSEKYSIFLVVLHYLLKFAGKNIKDEVIFLQDNATIHHGKLIKRIATKLDLWMHFLPTYSSEIAAVELIFGVLKRKIRTTRTVHLIDFRCWWWQRVINEFTKQHSIGYNHKNLEKGHWEGKGSHSGSGDGAWVICRFLRNHSIIVFIRMKFFDNGNKNSPSGRNIQICNKKPYFNLKNL